MYEIVHRITHLSLLCKWWQQKPPAETSSPAPVMGINKGCTEAQTPGEKAVGTSLPITQCNRLEETND